LALLDHHAQHPAFAISVAAVYRSIRPWTAVEEEHLWILAVHAVSLVGFGFLVAGIYVFGREWIGEEAGLFGAGAALVSPPMVRIAGDALSDSPSAALLVWSVVFFARYLRQGSWVELMWGGMLAGWGYLFRPEAIQFALAMLFVLLISWIRRPTQLVRLTKWLALASILSLFVVPYIVIKGSFLTKKSYLLDPLVLQTIQPPLIQAVSSRSTPVAIAVPEVSSPTPPPPLPTEIAEPAPNAPLPTAASAPLPAVVASEPIREPTSVETAVAETESASMDASPAETHASMLLPKYIPAIDLRVQRYAEGLGLFLLLWSSLLAHSLTGMLPIGLLVVLVTRPGKDTAMIVLGMLCNLLLLPALLFCACGYLDVRHVVPVFALSAPLIWPGGLALCRAVRFSLSWTAKQVRGEGIRWPGSAEWATAPLMLLTMVIIGGISLSLRSNEQVAGLRTLGHWVREQIPREIAVIDPSYVTAFYAGMDGNNRWPYVGNLSPENLADVLDAYPDARYVILSDRQASEAMGIDHWPTDLGHWHLREVHSERISARVDDHRLVRLFAVDHEDASATAGHDRTTNSR
jgi:hypothetical protein